MPQPLSQGRPLAWHLGMLCTALLVPMLALGGFLLVRMAEAERTRHEGVAREAARQIAIALDRGLTTYQAMLEVLATSDYLRAGNLAAFRQRALEVPRPAGAEIVLRDAAGRILAETGSSSLPPAANRPPGEADRKAAATGRPQVSDVIATAAADAVRSFLVVAPVRGKEGDVLYLLGLDVPISVLGSLLRREEVPDGMVASLADRNGIVAARSAEHARYTGLRLPAHMLDGIGDREQGWIRTEANEGTIVVAAFARSGIAGWTAVVSLPEASFAAPLRRSLYFTTAFGLLLGALAAGLAHAVARRIARPIEALAGIAAAGSDEAPLVTPVREVNAVAGMLAAAQAERQRRAAEREALLQTLDRAQVLVREPGGAITLWTSGMERLFGWSRSQALGGNSHALLQTEFPRPLPEIEAELLARGEWRGELRQRRADGALVVVASHWALRRGEAGEALAVVEACNDITALREAEAALRRSRDLLSSVLEGSADPIFAKDAGGRYVILNSSAAGLLGTTVEAAIGRRAADIVDPALAATLEATDRAVIATGQVRVAEDEVALPGGGRRILLSTKAPWRDASGATLGIVGVSRDITARRHAEAQLRETQAELFRVARINAMGAMAAALAHELNQPLTAAANFAEAAGLFLAGDGPAEPARLDAAREAMAEAAAEVVRAGRILQRLREFVGRGDTEKRSTDLNAIVEKAVSLALAGTPDAEATLRLDLAPGMPPVLADAVQLQQVVVNLVRNAAEAMRGAARRELLVATAPDGPEAVEVSVADSGPGLAADLDGRLFEPFVTTKRDGMGIGLSISRSIIQGHGGRLEAAARPGGGTVFRFVLPVLRVRQEEHMDAG
ncbi:PAS domain-containing protein [Roseicella aerolata]|uniref:histidine kinase n=1 Tax=Roseicella aerolata TaxID=2883479 RepID=A0A9X1L8Z2_9PROT|nr:PAS domain-containing protein [Roseicella aerolata]MCB4823571.1 PAS domain-containing protein [Roseicella aerolata]